MFIDLHLHTYFSDGTMTPEEIVQIAKEKGLEAIAITDHNKVLAWPYLEKAAKKVGIIPIKGSEINCKYAGRVLHLLAYGFRDEERLLSLIHQSDVEMLRMSDDLVEKLSQVHSNISREDYDQYAYDPRKGGWKGIHYLLERSITESLFDGFSYYKDYNCDFVDYDFPDIKVLCEAIHEAGGVAIVAHPGESFRGMLPEALAPVLEDLRLQGIDGVECYYPTHTEALTEVTEDFCKKYNLITTAGSDEHGEFGKHAKKIPQTVGCLNRKVPNFPIERLLVKSI